MWGLVVSNTAWGWYMSGDQRIEYWGYYFSKAQIDLIKKCGATAISIGLDKCAWDTGSLSNILGIPYKDYIKQLVTWCKPELKVIANLHRDSTTGDNWDTKDSTTEGKGAVILNYNGLRDAWINWEKDVISYLNPDAIYIMGEPRGGAGTITFDYYYDNFLIPSINACRSVKPNIPVFVHPFPFYATQLFANRPVNDPNVFYQFHLYQPQEYPYTGSHAYFNNAANAYYEGNLADAKYWLYKYLDDYKFAGVPKNKIFWGEHGCYDNIGGVQQWWNEPNQPNWKVYLKDVYDYAKERGLVGVTQFAAGATHYCILHPDTGYTTLTPYGEAWAANMPGVQPSPQPNLAGILLIGALFYFLLTRG